MGSIIVSINDLKSVLKKIAGRARVEENSNVPGLLNIEVPQGRMIEVEEYLRMHLPYSIKTDIKPLRFWDVLFLWTIKHRSA